MKSWDLADEAKRRMDSIRSACQTRIEDRGPDAVISCRAVLEMLGGEG